MMSKKSLDSNIIFLSFNQDFSCVSVGTKTGYTIYNCDPFGSCYSKSDGGIGIVEMLFCTSLIALVGAGEQPAFSPRRLQIINTKRQSIICELNFVTTILAVKLNRKRLVVILEENIHIYDISNMKILHTIDTSPNPSAVCSLSPSSENCYLAYPVNAQEGKIIIYDAITLTAVNMIQAHKAPLVHLAFNYDGKILASASDKGTVIRVHSIPDASQMYQFRRGSMPAKINSITFNLQSNLLCVSSDSETVHIFKLSLASGTSSNRKTSLVGNYLPEILTEMWEPHRDFAHLKLPSNGVQGICAMSPSSNHVMVATTDGYFFLYSIDLESGGECTLAKTHL